MVSVLDLYVTGLLLIEVGGFFGVRNLKYAFFRMGNKSSTPYGAYDVAYV